MLSMLRQNKILMTVKTIFTLADAAHAAAVEKGFYEEEKTLARLVSLIISESGEIVEAMRKDRHFNPANYAVGGPFVAQQFEAEVKDTVGDEIADTIIRLLDLIGCYYVEPGNEFYIDRNVSNIIKEESKKFDRCNDWDEMYIEVTKLITRVSDSRMPPVLGEKKIFASNSGIKTIFVFTLIHSCVCIWALFALANKMGVPDIDFHIQEKMKYNRTRPHKHGKKF